VSGSRQAWLVAHRELRERGRSRAFWIALGVMLIGVAGAIALPALLDTGPGTKDVGLTGTTSGELPAALEAQGDAVDTTIRIHHYDTVNDGEGALRDEDVDVLVIDSQQLEWLKGADEQLKAVVAGAIQLVAVRERAVAAGIDPDELVEMVAPVPITNTELGQSAGRSADDETAAFILTLLLFGAISTYGAMVLSGVVEEKSSRTVEVLLARMPARNLLAGKIVGIGVLGLAQVAATALIALVTVAVVDSVDLPAISGGVIAWAVAWFVLGYALYATVYGVLGSLASRTEDASSVAGPVTVVMVLGFMAAFASIGSADTAWARIVSWVPVTAPIAMPNRIAMGEATWWDPIFAMVLTLATIGVLVVLGGRVYNRAILHTGAILSLSDAWRGAPAVVASQPDVIVEKEDTVEIAPRTQILLVVVAAAVCGAVFAISQDFVIGVAAGAAVFALGSRAIKERARIDHDTAQETPDSKHPDRDAVHR
jgi:ABC-2 type transport system permease protein